METVKQNKAYNIHSLPIINWYQLQENFQNENFDFSPLFELSENLSVTEGFGAYENIVKDLPSVNIESQLLHTLLALHTTRWRILSLMNSSENKSELLKKALQKANNFYGMLTINLEKENQYFQVKTYKIIDNWRVKWNELSTIPAPSPFADLLDSGFQVSHPSLLDYIAQKELKEHSSIMLNTIFTDNFIEVGELKFSKISDYLSPIEKMLTENGDFDTFIQLRPVLLDFGKNEKVPQRENEGLKAMYKTTLSLESKANIRLDIYKDSLMKLIMSVKTVEELNKPRNA